MKVSPRAGQKSRLDGRAAPEEALRPQDANTARILEELRAAVMGDGERVRRIAEEAAVRGLAT